MVLWILSDLDARLRGLTPEELAQFKQLAEASNKNELAQ